MKLIKYFLAALTIKEDDLWVNLSPYEKNRMISEEFGKTELGRDMLAQDYILKQLTASLIYPEKELGKKFWDNVYAKAQQMFGTSQVPVNTFNKVWIVADKAKVLERNNAAFVVGAHLKVMLEEDYLALGKNANGGHEPEARRDRCVSPQRQGNHHNALSSQIIRQIILPEIEKEVNQGKNFAPLRQMFYSMILASWYKLALKNALLNQVYSNKNKTSGVQFRRDAINGVSTPEEIYGRYLQAYKKGVFNYIKEDSVEKKGEKIPRKYFSGGLRILFDAAMIMRVHDLPDQADATALTGDALVRVEIQPDGAMTAREHEADKNRRWFLKMGVAAAVALSMPSPAWANVPASVRQAVPEPQQKEKEIFQVDRITDWEGADIALQLIARAKHERSLSGEVKNLIDAIRIFKGNKDSYTVKYQQSMMSDIFLMGGKLNQRPEETGDDQFRIYIVNNVEEYAIVIALPGQKLLLLRFVDRNFEARLLTPEEFKIISDQVTRKEDQSMTVVHGGIDLNAKKMGLDVDQEGKSVQVKFDAAMMAEFQQGNFTGVRAVIRRIVPIASPLPILGLEMGPADKKKLVRI
ncbi:MAG: hypothetical protein HY591_01700 [Candidatus Omnitrophica bacterium]|nr:hypothetical protein [Candidatus Omnitrophota bacterium]